MPQGFFFLYYKPRGRFLTIPHPEFPSLEVWFVTEGGALPDTVHLCVCLLWPHDFAALIAAFVSYLLWFSASLGFLYHVSVMVIK